MTCDNCTHLEARIEALLDELHDLRVAEADRQSVEQARGRHPTTRDWCPPNGIRRPVLYMIGGDK